MSSINDCLIKAAFSEKAKVITLMVNAMSKHPGSYEMVLKLQPEEISRKETLRHETSVLSQGYHQGKKPEHEGADGLPSRRGTYFTVSGCPFLCT